MTTPSTTSRRDSARHRLRMSAAAAGGLMTLVYVWMFFAVRSAEAGADENTFGAYLQLGLVYAVGTALLLLLDRRWVWAVGMVVQVIVAGLFAVFGRAILDYDLVQDLPLWLWVALTSLGQAVLLVLLGSLLLTTRTHEADESGPTRAGRRSTA